MDTDGRRASQVKVRDDGGFPHVGAIEAGEKVESWIVFGSEINLLLAFVWWVKERRGRMIACLLVHAPGMHRGRSHLPRTR